MLALERARTSMEIAGSSKQLKRRGLDLEDTSYQVKCSRVEEATACHEEAGQNPTAPAADASAEEARSHTQEHAPASPTADTPNSDIHSSSSAGQRPPSPSPPDPAATAAAAQSLALLPPLALPVPQRRATLVLDMDKTLIFKEWRLQPYDRRPQVVFRPDFTFGITYRGYPVQYHVKKRPFLDQFLARAAQLFEVVLFTASEAIVTHPVVARLDPDRRLFSHVLCRAACTERNGFYVKDLARLGRDLARVAIVDDNPDSFAWQPANAILVPEFSGWEDHDRELLRLLGMLDLLAAAQDVRAVVAALARSRQAAAAAVAAAAAPPAVAAAGAYRAEWVPAAAAGAAAEAGGAAAEGGWEQGEQGVAEDDGQDEESEDSVVYL